MLTLIFLFPVAGCDAYSFSCQKKVIKYIQVSQVLSYLLWSTHYFCLKVWIIKTTFKDKFFHLNVNVCITSFYSLCPPGWVFPLFSDPHFLKRVVASPWSVDISQWYSHLFSFFHFRCGFLAVAACCCYTTLSALSDYGWVCLYPLVYQRELTQSQQVALYCSQYSNVFFKQCFLFYFILYIYGHYRNHNKAHLCWKWCFYISEYWCRARCVCITEVI